MPKFTIILPIRNGSNHVRECIHGIVSQTLDDFALVVLENASTDDTLDIIRSFNDSRIKIIPSDKPLSMEENWHRAVQVEKGTFVTLIGHDDVLHPDYLATMSGLIDKYPDASLYQTHFHYIDAQSKITGNCQQMAEKQSAPEAVENFITGKNDLMGTGFMMRSKDYEAIGGIPRYPSLLFADMELWIELARIGYLAVSPSFCFSYRRHASATTASSADKKFLDAFDELIDYLEDLRSKDSRLSDIVSRSSNVLLKGYCQGITHRILRTPKNRRETPSIDVIIDRFRQYGERLGNPNFEPLDYREINLGRMIDSNVILRTAFLFFKTLMPKPVLKS